MDHRPQAELNRPALQTRHCPAAAPPLRGSVVLTRSAPRSGGGPLSVRHATSVRPMLARLAHRCPPRKREPMSARPHRHSLPFLVALVATSVLATLTTSVAGAQNVPTAHDTPAGTGRQVRQPPVHGVPEAGAVLRALVGRLARHVAGPQGRHPRLRASAGRPRRHLQELPLQPRAVPDGLGAGHRPAARSPPAPRPRLRARRRAVLGTGRRRPGRRPADPRGALPEADLQAQALHQRSPRAGGGGRPVPRFRAPGRRLRRDVPPRRRRVPCPGRAQRRLGLQHHGRPGRRLEAVVPDSCTPATATSTGSPRTSTAASPATSATASPRAASTSASHRVAPWPGFYRWARHAHPRKPIMLSEWGAFSNVGEAKRVRYLAHRASSAPQLPAA